MDQQKWLAEQFEDHRPRLRGGAYRMLGALSEADDAVQDAWLRVSRADTSDIENLSAWLTAVVARVALNMLRARRTRREQPLDTHLPDPIIDSTDRPDPPRRPGSSRVTRTLGVDGDRHAEPVRGVVDR